MLSRVTVWVSFQILTAAAQNTEFDNIVDYINALETSFNDLLTRVVIIKVVRDNEAVAVGDNKTKVTIPALIDGMNLIAAEAHVYTASTAGTPTIQIARDRGGAVVDMLSTPITIDENEEDSTTATVPMVVNGANDDVLEGDEIRIDVDVAGTGTAGLEIRLTFQAP
jgi:hypothetical protein